MLAIVETGGEALAWNERAIHFAEQSDDELAKGWLGSLYNNLGWTYHDLGEFAKALDCFERDLAWFEVREKNHEAIIAKYSIARVQQPLMEKPQVAYDMLMALLREIDKLKFNQDGFIFEELGENALLLKMEPEVICGYFKQAYDLLSKNEYFSSTEPARLERMKNLGNG